MTSIDPQLQDRTTAKISRISKACEPCRTRRTRCDISSRPVCSECEKRDTAGDCVVREKARPKRPRPDGDSTRQRQSKSARIDDHPPAALPAQSNPRSETGSMAEDPPIPPILSNPHPTPAARASAGYTPVRSKIHPSGISQVEKMVEEFARDSLDLIIDLTLPPEKIFPTGGPILSLHDLGFFSSDPSNQSRHWINMHFGAIHHNTPFLHLPQIYQISDRFFGPSSTSVSVGGDELALLYAVLALGAFREETWDPSRGSYRPRESVPGQSPLSHYTESPSHHPTYNATASSSQPHQFPTTGTSSLTLFRLANEELDNLELPSELAVQALFLMHNFVSNTVMGRRSRDFVARAVSMSHEIGLNRGIPLEMGLNSMDKRITSSQLKRRAILYLYVYFSDVYLTALDNQPPLIKSSDFEPSVFDPILIPSSESGTATPAGATVSGLASFVDVVRVIGLVLEELHGNMAAASNMSVEQVLRLDNQLDALRGRLSSWTFGQRLDVVDRMDQAERARVAGRLLRQIHFNWCRIALRTTFLQHPLLGHSSLAICVRAASSVLSQYRQVCSAGFLNLPWMQLRRISTCTQLIFLGFWKGELLNQEAEESIDHALTLTKILGTRWSASQKLTLSIIRISKASGLRCRQVAAEPHPLRPTQPLPSSDVPPFDPFSLWTQTMQPPESGDLLQNSQQTVNSSWYPPTNLNGEFPLPPSLDPILNITDNNGLLVTDWDAWFQSLV